MTGQPGVDSTVGGPTERRATPLPRPPLALPRAPLLDWQSFAGRRSTRPPVPSLQSHAAVAYTTSGRAAIHQALLQLELPASSRVLLPTYHCPTMVAPVLQAGMVPVFFGLLPDGLPDLDGIDARDAESIAAEPAQKARVMVVAHYFGLPRSLAHVRRWCDARGIALIEDCAHCFFGHAGERPVGAWGDFATASLSKFLPVPEAGLLASARREIRPPVLQPQGLRSQLKGCVDVLELSVQHRRLAGLRPLLGLLFALKNRTPGAKSCTTLHDAADAGTAGGASAPPRQVAPGGSATALLSDDAADAAATDASRGDAGRVEAMTLECDMGRVTHAPLWVSMALQRILPRPRILSRRRENFAQYLRSFGSVRGARPLFAAFPAAAAPYVFPLWVDEADRVYAGLRALGLPVFRWDRIWPGTPALPVDSGALWSRHVLQLLCHQDLRPHDVARTVAATLTLLADSSAVRPVLPAASPAPMPASPNQPSSAADRELRV